MKKDLITLIIVFLIILGVLVSFLLYGQWPMLTGERIVLDTRPVDPFDPFRGQYMQIAYEISRVEASNFDSGDRIYVLLKEDEGGVWRFDGVARTKPSKGDFIKGKVKHASGDSVNVEYGIEKYFFEKNANIPTQNITVEVRVTSSGRAGLIQLLQNGEPVEIDYQGFDIRN